MTNSTPTKNPRNPKSTPANSRKTKAPAPTPPSKRWPNSSLPSTQREASQQETHRKPPTEPLPPLSCPSERAQALNLKPLARFVSFATAGCLPEEMGLGPVLRHPQSPEAGRTDTRSNRPHRTERSLRRASISRNPASRTRPRKSKRQRRSRRPGPPAGLHRSETLTATLLHEMKRRNLRYGLVTMCVGGGMGAAGIFENFELKNDEQSCRKTQAQAQEINLFRLRTQRFGSLNLGIYDRTHFAHRSSRSEG